MGSKKVTDYDILKKHYTFLNDEKDESWESGLVSDYHESLFKEYVVCDLSRYKTGEVGFCISCAQVALRWRTAQEVVDGKCENVCASVSCGETKDLCSYEVLFNYVEHKTKKQARILGSIPQALVKVRVCPDCSYKLNYKLKHKKVERDRGT